jgi:FkbM family methyltransferase
MKVRSFSEIKENYEDFVIVVSFASNRPEVISLIRDMADKYTVYIPDMPVAGNEYFDLDFYNAHYDEIKEAYSSLADDESRAVFASMVRYKLTADPRYLFANTCSSADILSLIPNNIRKAVDAGAYNGDTVREMLAAFPDIERIYAVEPDARNYKKLLKFITESNLSEKVMAEQFAVWSSDCEGGFIGSGNRNSSVNSSASYKSREESVPLRSLDNAIDDTVDYIKYDVEGAELEALVGSNSLIWGNRPALLVSAYHRSEDIFSLVNKISREYPFYDIRMRRTECFPAWEIAIIAVENV